MAAAAADGAPIQVADAFEGFVRLERRSPTLDGSIPLRAAQACVPLLEGNSAGFSVVLSSRIELTRRLATLAISSWAERDRMTSMAKGVLPMLALRGMVPPEEARSFQWSPVVLSRRGAKVEIFTGLLLESPPGVRLRISTSANRRSRAFVVREAFIGAEDGRVPLVLELEISGKPDHLALDGEIASIVPLPERVTVARELLSRSLDAARAHVRFFDREYFESKKKAPTRKYKQLVKRAPLGEGSGIVRVVHAGPTHLDVGADRVTVRAGMDLRFTFDGNTLAISPDTEQLKRFAREVRAVWSPVLDHALQDEEAFRGALLYLSKYVTPHPHGEPHFFVKPPALMVTPRGWSTIVDGVKTPDFDVLRGVVRTDIFHAVPLVFTVTTLAKRLEVRRGDVLAELFPSPRSILEREFRMTPIKWNHGR